MWTGRGFAGGRRVATPADVSSPGREPPAFRLVLRKGTPPALARRPECGNDAMLWKERHFARTDLFTKLVVLPATIVLTVFVLLQGELDEKVVRSFMSVWRFGYTALARLRST